MSRETDSAGDSRITVRFAEEADSLLLAKFRYAFRSSIDTVNEGEEEFVERCRLWMRDRLRDNYYWKCWIAEQGRTPVGNLWMQLIEKIPNPTAEPEYHAYVTNFYVQEGARGRGIGSVLLSAALEWAKSQDVQAVILWPTQQSRSLYLRKGFRVREDLLELIIFM